MSALFCGQLEATRIVGAAKTLALGADSHRAVGVIPGLTMDTLPLGIAQLPGDVPRPAPRIRCPGGRKEIPE